MTPSCVFRPWSCTCTQPISVTVMEVPSFFILLFVIAVGWIATTISGNNVASIVMGVTFVACLIVPCTITKCKSQKGVSNNSIDSEDGQGEQQQPQSYANQPDQQGGPLEVNENIGRQEMQCYERHGPRLHYLRRHSDYQLHHQQSHNVSQSQEGRRHNHRYHRSYNNLLELQQLQRACKITYVTISFKLLWPGCCQPDMFIQPSPVCIFVLICRVYRAPQRPANISKCP